LRFPQHTVARFYAELFNSTNPAGQFLSIDSSIMNITTSGDAALPRSLIVREDGKERFRKYIPFPSFVTNDRELSLPISVWPVVLGVSAHGAERLGSQEPHGTNNPITVADWKAALDVTVLKQGVFTFYFSSTRLDSP